MSLEAWDGSCWHHQSGAAHSAPDYAAVQIPVLLRPLLQSQAQVLQPCSDINQVVTGLHSKQQRDGSRVRRKGQAHRRASARRSASCSS